MVSNRQSGSKLEALIESPPGDWYRPIAKHLGSAYLRYSFTKGTAQEVDFLTDVLRIRPGQRLLDVGTGPGRHSLEFARRGVDVTGIDLSGDFLDVAREQAATEHLPVALFEMDARTMIFDSEFDAVISICEGAFSLGFDDLSILRKMTAALKPGGHLAVGAVNVFYVLEHMKASGEFDPSQMLYKETVDVIGADGSKVPFAMWNSCYTPRELEWIANGAGLDPQVVYGISPGEYKQQEPSKEHPELLLIASRPAISGTVPS